MQSRAVKPYATHKAMTNGQEKKESIRSSLHGERIHHCIYFTRPTILLTTKKQQKKKILIRFFILVLLAAGKKWFSIHPSLAPKK